MDIYHAHIYFELKDMALASSLFGHMKNKQLFFNLEFYDKIIGPHPLPMIEAHFHEANFEVIKSWLSDNRNSLSVLLHHDTGDDYKDHTDNICWLGDELTINFGFFELIKKFPHLRIHN